jgi:hypothetical protein
VLSVSIETLPISAVYGAVATRPGGLTQADLMAHLIAEEMVLENKRKDLEKSVGPL